MKVFCMIMFKMFQVAFYTLLLALFHIQVYGMEKALELQSTAKNTDTAIDIPLPEHGTNVIRRYCTYDNKTTLIAMFITLVLLCNNELLNYIPPLSPYAYTLALLTFKCALLLPTFYIGGPKIKTLAGLLYAYEMLHLGTICFIESRRTFKPMHCCFIEWTYPCLSIGYYGNCCCFTI